MFELKTDLMNGIADYRSLLRDLDGCLSRLIDAEEDLQRYLQRLARLESWLDPRRLLGRLHTLFEHVEIRPPIAH